ncbi:MAG: single-stranded DNA-binding protein [Algoriphagus sp.]|jgi:single-strand DNA-binding protein|nr:single-stranded DNA-binding protein [Algoriphagus sp.]
MNALRNKVQLIGNLGSKIEVKTTESGKVVGRVNIATNEVYRNAKGEKITETTWTNLVIWGKNAEILEKYTDKGSEIAIEGKLSNRTYTDKSGEKKYITEVVVNEVLLLGGGSKAEKAHSEAAEANYPF